MRLLFAMASATTLVVIATPSVSQSMCESCTFSLTGAEAPSPQLWTQPAALSLVESSDEGEDRQTVDLAAKLSRAVGHHAGDWTVDSWFVRAIANVSDQSKKEQERYAGEVGLKLDWNPTRARYRGRIEGMSAEQRREAQNAVANAWSAFIDVSAGLNSKAVFANLTTPPCAATPSLPQCQTQHQRSVTLAFDFQPYHCAFEAACPTSRGEAQLDTKGWSFAFSPRARLFYDEVTEAVLNDQGIREEGSVAGARVSLDLAVSPPVFNNRLVFRVGTQRIIAFSRSALREERFPRDTELNVASLDIELGHRSVQPGAGWVPSIGVAYTEGEDPLAGRTDRSETTYGFRLTYKSK